jgi:protein involved in polysaccharide export with SLBB domain
MKRIAVLSILLGLALALALQAQSSSLLQSMLQGGNSGMSGENSRGGATTPTGTFGGLNAGNAGSLNLPSQSTDLTFGSLATIPNGRAQLASTTMSYFVTPGDFYTLSFLQNTNAVSVPLAVQADYTIDLGIFGTQNAKGMTFQTFKSQLEKKVAAAYPGSSPVVLIESTGIFMVKVDGEVTKADLAQVWGLEQLSDLFPQIATAFSSLRHVQVRSSDGTEKSYDLFLASRTGNFADDPYLRPGDEVTLFKADRTVTLEGAVYRPGTYQLLPGEAAGDLVWNYGQGPLPTARTDLAALVRKASNERPEGESLFFDAANRQTPPSLIDGDKITVPTKDTYLPVVYIEGAIAPADVTGGVTIVSQQNMADLTANGPVEASNNTSNSTPTTPLQEPQPAIATNGAPAASFLGLQPAIATNGASIAPLLGLQPTIGPSASSAFVGPQTTIGTGVEQGNATQIPSTNTSQYSLDRYPFKPGDMASRVLRTVAPRLLPTADLRRAFIARKGQADTIPLDVERLLFEYEPSLDVVLQPEDRIVIPSGSLDIFVTGEVTKSTWVNAAALTRLSSVISHLLTRYSSTRDIVVKSAGGEERSFDLFKANRYGNLSQDPFLKPGDIVTINTVMRMVTVSGEVKKPGTYQLLPGEELKDLIELYGNGFTELANPLRLQLVRYVSTTSSVGEAKIIDFSQGSNVDLMNYDTVTVPPTKDLLPCVYFEGALGVGINGENPQTSQRISYTFHPGEMLSQAIQKLRSQFSAVSDISNAYIQRGDTKIPVDLANYLYKKDFSYDSALVANDTIIVPFRQFFVSVAGAVKIPGRYPYVPDRGWEYYVDLAGGIDQDKNTGQALDVIDVQGKPHSKNGPILPEDSIVVASNSFLYYFGQVSPIITTVISTAALILSLIRLY